MWEEMTQWIFSGVKCRQKLLKENEKVNRSEFWKHDWQNERITLWLEEAETILGRN